MARLAPSAKQTPDSSDIATIVAGQKAKMTGVARKDILTMYVLPRRVPTMAVAHDVLRNGRLCSPTIARSIQRGE
jgi:hypothetical protein